MSEVVDFGGMKKLFLSLAVVAGLCSCSSRLGDFTMISTRNIDLNRIDGYKVDTTQRIEGEDIGHIIIVFPTRTPNIKEAIDDAIRKGGPDCVGVSDAVIDDYWWWVPYIYGRSGVTVKGYPILKK